MLEGLSEATWIKPPKVHKRRNCFYLVHRNKWYSLGHNPWQGTQMAAGYARAGVPFVQPDFLETTYGYARKRAKQLGGSVLIWFWLLWWVPVASSVANPASLEQDLTIFGSGPEVPAIGHPMATIKNVVIEDTPPNIERPTSGDLFLPIGRIMVGDMENCSTHAIWRQHGPAFILSDCLRTFGINVRDFSLNVLAALHQEIYRWRFSTISERSGDIPGFVSLGYWRGAGHILYANPSTLIQSLGFFSVDPRLMHLMQLTMKGAPLKDSNRYQSEREEANVGGKSSNWIALLEPVPRLWEKLLMFALALGLFGLTILFWGGIHSSIPSQNLGFACIASAMVLALCTCFGTNIYDFVTQ